MQPNPEEEQLNQLALTFVDGIGPKLARMLLAHFGTATAVMQALPRELKHIGGMGEVKAKACKDPLVRERAEAEYAFMQKHRISSLFLTDEDYPVRLKQCEDAPTLLYYRGAIPPQAQKVVAVIGTRKNTEYGQRATEALIDGLAGQDDLIVVSGLAYGIDAIAHRRCLQVGIPTIGVVGHGLDRMYPAAHKSLAREMVASGGILTEFPSGTLPDRANFPVRNRVVAGLSDITVVVESDEKGGAMITAYMAASYDREVAAFPGRAYDAKSSGPNKLIRINIAHLIQNAADLLQVMNWTGAGKGKQQPLFHPYSPEEQMLIDALKDKDAVHADDLLLQTGMQHSQLSAALLQLEMAGAIKTLPGKRYRLS